VSQIFTASQITTTLKLFRNDFMKVLFPLGYNQLQKAIAYSAITLTGYLAYKIKNILNKFENLKDDEQGTKLRKQELQSLQANVISFGAFLLSKNAILMLTPLRNTSGMARYISKFGVMVLVMTFGAILARALNNELSTMFEVDPRFKETKLTTLARGLAYETLTLGIDNALDMARDVAIGNVFNSIGFSEVGGMIFHIGAESVLRTSYVSITSNLYEIYLWLTHKKSAGYDHVIDAVHV
jgi:hypothetical protein